MELLKNCPNLNLVTNIFLKKKAVTKKKEGFLKNPKKKLEDEQILDLDNE